MKMRKRRMRKRKIGKWTRISKRKKMRKRTMMRKMRKRNKKKTLPVCLRHSALPAPPSAPIPSREATPQAPSHSILPSDLPPWTKMNQDTKQARHHVGM